MGFFSWRCAKCGQPVLNAYAVDSTTRALCKAVVLLQDRIVVGTYDGYGRIDDYEIPCGDDPVIMHECCYRNGQFRDLAPPCPDPGQGLFYSKQEIRCIHEAMKAFCAARPVQGRTATPNGR